MIHPLTELRFVNKEIGYGVFATAPIPKGTILYVKDPLDIEISADDFKKFDDEYKNIIEKYSYIDERGIRIISWDHAKYVNHKCDCNSMSTGYGFEIAIKDIGQGEEITDEYGLFNIPFPIALNCGCNHCRQTVFSTDIYSYLDIWDSQVISALSHVQNVDQPLWHLIENETAKALNAYLSGKEEYRSLMELKYFPSSNDDEWIKEKEAAFKQPFLQSDQSEYECEDFLPALSQQVARGTFSRI